MTKTTLESIDERIKRFERKLSLTLTLLNKLRKQRDRMVKRMADETVKTMAGVEPKAFKTLDYDKVEREAKEIMGLVPDPQIDEAAIPAFLDRANPVVAEEMTAKRKEAEAEERRKMPLSGKAALDAIKQKGGKRGSRVPQKAES